MNVKELIKELKKWPIDMEVHFDALDHSLPIRSLGWNHNLVGNKVVLLKSSLEDMDKAMRRNYD